MKWLAAYFVRFRLLVAAAMIVVTGLATWGYMPEPPRTEVPPKEESPERTREFRPEPPTASEQVSNRFNLAQSESFLVIECDDFFRPDVVRALRSTVAAVEALPTVETVFWVDRIPLINVFGFADPLIPEEDASSETFEEARQRVLNHPLIRGQLLSPDGRTMMLPIIYNWLFVGSNEDLIENVTRTAREAFAEALRESETADPPEFRIRLTGYVPLFTAQKSAFERNQTTFRIIAYTLVIVLAIVMFRGLAAVLIVAGAPALGLYWTFGLLELFDVHTNDLANVVMPILVTMIGLTDGIHLMVHIRRRRADGESPLAAAEHAIDTIGTACWLTSLTTAIGFASLMLAHSSYVQDFGRDCCIGVLITFVAVVTFIPLLSTTRLARNIHQGYEHDFIGKGLHRTAWIVDAIIRHRIPVSLAFAAMTVLFGWWSLSLKADDRIADSLPSSTEAYQALAHCDESFGGIEFVRAVVIWPEGLAEDSPLILKSVREIHRLADDEPLLSHPLSIDNLLSPLPGDPDDLETRMTFLSLLPHDLRAFFFRPDLRRTVVVLRVQDRGIAAYAPVFDRLELELAGLGGEYKDFTFFLEGGPVGRSRNLYQIVVDLTRSLGTASIIIFFVLFIVYRSLRIGLVSLIPNIFPLVVTAMVLVVTKHPLDMSSVCAFVVCLGIAVDDTIHFLTRYRAEVEVDGDVRAAIRRTFLGVGTALVMTTVILVCGFATVTFSDLPAHRTFAIMACSTIGAALIGDMIALPALLATFARSPGQPPASNDSPVPPDAPSSHAVPEPSESALS